MIARRFFLLLPVLAPLAAWADTSDWDLLRRDGAIVLFRHANAPGTGDPPGFRLDECSTQRNLDARGRAEAKAIGEAFRAQGIKVGRVLSSQWCRARETADLAFPGEAREEPAFNSFFSNRANEPAMTARAKAILASWEGPGVLAVFTHQVNITALTDVVPKPGEGIIVQAGAVALRAAGRLPPPRVQI